MSLLHISEKNKITEDIIQNNVNDALDNKTSFVFDSGAGSGKTYCLITSIKYLLKKHRETLSLSNQKILCITYTNVATNEIKERLGDTNLVSVSTIHDMLWSFIEHYRKQLVEIHKINLIKEKKFLCDKLNDETDKSATKFSSYRDLDDDIRLEFYNYTLSVKDNFYRSYNQSASDFRTAMGTELLRFGNIGRNVFNLKTIMQCIYKLENIKSCIVSIEKKEDGYREVKYNSSNNRDIIHRMTISHDSVIKYAYQLFNKFPMVNKIFADMYPYVLIDEYQDTNNKVIKIMSSIDSLVSNKSGNFVVGYFGDRAQNIYDDGVGGSIEYFHKGLIFIEKMFNRRSSKEIISVINSIRNDEITQESIFSDDVGGSVKFYQLSENIDQKQGIDSFVTKYASRFNATENNKIHCLVLTNKILARLSGFPTIYTIISSSGYYTKYYDRINVEWINTNITKLGKVALLFYRIMHLNYLMNTKTNISNIFSDDFVCELTYKEISNLLRELKSIEFKNIYGFLKGVFDYYQNSSKHFRSYIDELFMIDNVSYDSLIDFITFSLYPDMENEKEVEQKKDIVVSFLSLDINEFRCWYNYIMKNINGNIEYHTYHGTKGIEFDNVIIIMENNFGLRNRGKFSKYFNDIRPNLESLGFDEQREYENTRNLLYVSCSRAIKNLRILYLDDTSNFKSGIESVFSEIHKYP